MEDKLKLYLDQELLEVAVGFVTNGDDIPREAKDRVQMAISLDNRSHLIRLNGRLDKVEDHFLHKITLKRLTLLVGLFLTVSSFYIEESRTFLIGLAKALIG